jgi:hypothetical protein
MSPVAASPLPSFDRTLLRAVERIVPGPQREEWSRTWRAELWHMHHRDRRARTFGITIDLSIGLVCDALWLRTDCWGRALSGTPTLCLGSLLGLCLLSALMALALNGSWHALAVAFWGPFKRSLFASLLVVFVSFATASRGYVEQSAGSSKVYAAKRQIFFWAKAALVLLLAFLVSADICRPIHTVFPNTADAFQLLLFVPLVLLGLRWAFGDQERRCKQCLRALAMPARVGRPSHNLLEWNGTELTCKQGHGRLSVPEMETSWCDSSQWVELNPAWD